MGWGLVCDCKGQHRLTAMARQASEQGIVAPLPPTAGLVAGAAVGCDANKELYKCESILYKPILSAHHLYLEHLFLLETLKPCYIRARLSPLA